MMEFEKIVSQAHLNASGWDLDSFLHSSPFDCHYFYVHDIDSKDVRLFSIKRSDFNAAPVPVNVPMPALAFFVAESLEKLRQGKLNPIEDSAFLPKLISYAKGTQSYASWRKQGKLRLHFILNVYRSLQGPEKALLRPLVANSDEVVLPAADMMSLSKQVIGMDKVKHPEWFV